MKFKIITVAGFASLLFPLSLPAQSQAAEQPCQAYFDSTNNSDVEKNNCPITVGNFSIRGTFSNLNWQASFWQWEPGYYILYVKNKQNGQTINLTGFKVMGTTNRPQYQFTDQDNNRTYTVTFRYESSKTIRLEIDQNNRIITNELLSRESDELIGGP